MKPEVGDVFDAPGTLERMGGDPGLLRDMARFLADDGPRLMERLEGSVRAGQVAEAERAAHTLKGLVSMFGAARSVAQALEVEMAAKDGRLDKIAGLLPTLRESLSSVIAAVERYLAGK
jgi:HPt (histidine-containing phosphotransfer) domain-containing protein